MRGYVVYDNSYKEQDDRSGEDRSDHVKVAEGFDLFRADIGDEGGSPTGRMQRFRDLHEHNGYRYRRGGCQPGFTRDKLVNGDTCKCTDEVTADKVTWLRKGTVDVAVEEDGRSTKGAYKKKIVGLVEIATVEEADEPDTTEGPDEGPEVLLMIDEGFFIDDITYFPYLPLDLLTHTFQKGANIRRGQKAPHTFCRRKSHWLKSLARVHAP